MPARRDPKNMLSRVAPSTVRALVDALPAGTLTDGQGPTVAGIVRLCREIPADLLPVDREDYARFVQAVEALDFAVGRWSSGGNTTVSTVVNGVQAVKLLRDALSKCRDEPVSARPGVLMFIRPAEFRQSILTDINAAESAIRNNEWKGATVLAGSVLEALLLWAVEKRSAAELAAAVAAVKAVKPSLKFKGAPEDWGLACLIPLASQLGLIVPDTERVAESAKEFRNLIHPGRAKRVAAVCDNGTALAALAAVHLATRDLTP